MISMVFPDDYFPSEPGSRDIIDGNDLPVPFVITLVRKGSSDHVQPNFPTPGQIRSMFNTSKISECPEYATSPSTMSDPVEWRPSNQLNTIEERLLRIHQWTENTYQTRPYEGNNITIRDISTSNSSIDDIINGGSETDFQLEQTVFDLSDRITSSLLNENFETRSQIKGSSSNNTLKSEEQENSLREYDVEEYVEHMNSDDVVIDNESNGSSENYHTGNEKEESTKLTEGIDRETYIRIKQLENIFKLEIKENDNAFIKELKTTLRGKIRDYIQQKNYKNMCPINENIEEVVEIVHQTINNNDSVICDNVHELCLQLKDILTLKEDIMVNVTRQFNMKEENDFHEDNELGNDTPADSLCSESSLKENDRYDEVTGAEENEEKFQNEGLKDGIKASNHDMFNEFQTNNKYETKGSDSFESLITFSRIPVAHQSKVRSGNNFIRPVKKIHKNLKSQYATTRIPSYNPSSKNESCNKKHNHESEVTNLISDCKEAGKSTLFRKNVNTANSNTKQAKDLMQQKQELVKKATLLGLIDDENYISSIPHLTERAQLALLEKQIQGRLKNRQLALERRKTGLPERITKAPCNNEPNKETDSNLLKSKPLRSPAGSNFENELSQKYEPRKQKRPVSTHAVRSKSKIILKTIKKSDNKNLETSSQTDDVIIISKFHGSLLESLPHETMGMLSNETYTDKEKPSPEILSNIPEHIGNKNNSDQEKEKKEIPLLTAFIAPKEKLDNWDNDNPSPSQSTENLQSNCQGSNWFLRLIIIGVIIAVFSAALYHYQPELCQQYLNICNEWIESLKRVNWKEEVQKHIERLKTIVNEKLQHC